MKQRKQFLILFVFSLHLLSLTGCSGIRPNQHDSKQGVFKNYIANYSFSVPYTYRIIPPNSPDYDQVFSINQVGISSRELPVAFFNRDNRTLLRVIYKENKVEKSLFMKSLSEDKNAIGYVGLMFSYIMQNIIERSFEKELDRRYLIIGDFKAIDSGRGKYNHYVITIVNFFALEIEKHFYYALIFPRGAKVDSQTLNTKKLALLLLAFSSDRPDEARQEIERFAKSFRFDAFTEAQRWGR